MTQKKLEILGPYTPEHEGPFCLDDEEHTPVELKIRDARGEFPLKGYVGDDEHFSSWSAQGRAIELNLMNAREVPVAREFWMNEYSWGFGETHFDSANDAISIAGDNCLGQRLFREVLPGEGE